MDTILQSLTDGVRPYLPSAIAMIGVIVVLWVVRLVIDRKFSEAPGYRFRRQLITLALLFAGLILIIMVAPLTDAQRGQLMSLIGLLVTAAIALSSATLVGNAMAGIMLRTVRNFRAGDFISLGDYFGRVTERGLFHIEIQTVDRDLITLPNLYLASHPVKVIRTSGTIISAEVSLGYDVPRTRISELLLEAARAAELTEPFVQVVSLGDFSVTYRIAGMLGEVKHYVSTRSRLKEMTLDALHRGGIEIVSPTFMNTRPLTAQDRFIPEQVRPTTAAAEEIQVERLAFDKADEAESLENLKESYAAVAKKLEELEGAAKEAADDATRGGVAEHIERLTVRKERLAQIIKRREAKDE